MRAAFIEAFVPAVIDVLRAAAAQGLPAPINRDIAGRVGLSADDQVTAALRIAKGRGLVRVECRGPRARIIAASDGSWRTAPPKGWASRSARVTERRAMVAPVVRSAPANPDAALAAAKVLRMWDDCVLRLVSNNSGSDCVTPAERARAERFCMAASGEGRAAREYWCTLAGIDPDALRERALRRRNAGGDAAAKVSAVAHVAAGGRAAAMARPAMGVSSLNSAGRGQPWPAIFSGDAR